MDAATANRLKNREPFKPAKSLRRAIRARGKKPGTITYFFSAKNDRDVVAPSDLQFAMGLWLEADESIRSWDSDPERVVAFIEHEGHIGTVPDAKLTRWSGQVEFVEAKYTHDRYTPHARFQAKAQQDIAALVGAKWTPFSEEDVRAKQSLLFDWLHIVPVLMTTRAAVKARYEWFFSLLCKASRNGIRLDELRHRAKDDWELTFAATFRLVQQGILRSDLDIHPLSASTVITLRERRGG